MLLLFIFRVLFVAFKRLPSLFFLPPPAKVSYGFVPLLRLDSFGAVTVFVRKPVVIGLYRYAVARDVIRFCSLCFQTILRSSCLGRGGGDIVHMAFSRRSFAVLNSLRVIFLITENPTV